MTNFDKAKQKIDSVIFKMWRSDAIIFSALSMLDKIPNSNYDTCGISVTSDRISLMYNPNFINAISTERLELVLITEAFRVLLRHPTTRLKEPPNISHLASSLAIGQLFNDDLEKLIQGIDEVMPDPKRFGLKDNQAYEEYYRELLEKQDKINKIIQQIWGGMSKEDKEKVLQQAIDNANKEDQNTDENGFQEFKDEKEAMKEYTNPNGNSDQGWGKNNGFDADVKAFINKVKNKSKMWGKYTGTAQGQILAAIDPKVSASDIIRKFGCSVLTGKTVPSRMRVNRRFDIERPGYRRVYQPSITVAIDVSGSMDDETLKYGFGIINKLLHYAKITYILFDTEITKIEKNFRKAKKEFAITGRGGTDYTKVFEYSTKNKNDGLVIFTDGCAAPVPKPKFRVLWLMSQRDQKPPCDFGFIVHLNRFDDSRSF